MNKKSKILNSTIFSYIFIAVALYPLLLPALFAWQPDGVTVWLDIWHILFGTLPAISPFLSEAENMVIKHGLSMPYTYYVHGFWVYFIFFLICAYAVRNYYRTEFVNCVRASLSLKTDRTTKLSRTNPKIGPFGHCLLLLFVFALFLPSVMMIFTDWAHNFLFEYSERSGLSRITNTWWGFQVKSLFIIFFCEIFILITLHNALSFAFRYFFSTSMRLRLLRMIKHKRL